MTEEYVFSIDELMIEIADELEDQLDTWISEQPPEDRPYMMAQREELLRQLTDATRAAAGDLKGIDFLARGVHAFRNVGEPVRLFTAVSQEMSGTLPIDPVCRMAVDPAHQSGVLIHHNAQYHVCSLTCAEAFAREPDRYARS